MQGIFVTGTDTGVGKTSASLALALCGLASGSRVVYFKPFQCGRRDLPSGARGGDAEWITEMSGGRVPSQTLYQLDSPVSPHLAAQRQGIALDWEGVRERFTTLVSQYDCAIVEGAGGVAAPVDSGGSSVGELGRRLGLPTCIVARPGLGTLNHTRLTAAFLRESGAPARGFVTVHTEPVVPEMAEDNVRTLTETTGLPFLGSLPHLQRLDREAPPGGLGNWARSLEGAWRELFGGRGMGARGAR